MRSGKLEMFRACQETAGSAALTACLTRFVEPVPRAGASLIPLLPNVKESKTLNTSVGLPALAAVSISSAFCMAATAGPEYKVPDP